MFRAFIICALFANLTVASAHAAAPTTGTIDSIQGDRISVRNLDSAVGDRLEVFIELPNVGAAVVGTLVVIETREDLIIAKIAQATGRIEAGQKVRSIAGLPAAPAASPPSPVISSPITAPVLVDPRDTRFPPWPTIKPNQPWIGESRWWANQRSVVLCGVLKDGPAGKAGLKADDTILTIAGKDIRNNGDLLNAVEEHSPGETINFEIERDGQRRTVPVTLEAIPPDGGNGRILAAAEAGESWAMMDIGVRYANMRGNISYFERNDAEAVRWFRRAIEAGYAAGPLFLAHMYRSGKGVEKDEAQAARLYEQARTGTGEGVHKGLFSSATINLGILYLNSLSVPPDPTKAAQLFREAADDGSLAAMHRLGILHENGQGVTKDLTKAMEFYHAAAQQDYAPAEYAIGLMAYEGRGVQRDYETARGWFESAAKHGDADAMYALGYIYEYGQGVAADRTRAVEWYRKAADKGNAKAKNRIGTSVPKPPTVKGLSSP